MSNKVFKRMEIKYIIDKEKLDIILPVIKTYLSPDPYGEKTIQSLYFDTNDNCLIRNSIEKPTYKEKLRLRSYGLIKKEDIAFLELKKKYNGVVFKRRILLSEEEAMNFINKKINLKKEQIAKEIEYFINYYKDLSPKFLILYDRIAFYQLNSDLRITFDYNIRYRKTNLNLHTNLNGKLIEEVKNKVVMEIKSAYSMPIWLAKLLNENKIYKQSFSKYGEAYIYELEKSKIKEVTKVG